MFQEMRLAATLQAVRLGAGSLTAREAVWMATREGARALGLDDAIGSLEVGKKADLIVVRTDGVHQAPEADPFTTLVYASRPTDVAATVVDGRVVAQAGRLTWAELPSLLEDATRARGALRERAGL
jgi:5-methylthioadenosine/S-adenosylhomocysteine deaminase